MFTPLIARIVNFTAALASAALLVSFVTLPPAQAQAHSVDVAAIRA